MIRISQLKLKVGHTREELFEEIIHQAHGKRPVSWRIVRKSVDARKKPQLFYVYTIDAEFENEKKLLSAKKSKCSQALSRCWLYLILCENLLCNSFCSFNTIHSCRSDSSRITCSFSTWKKTLYVTFKLFISFHTKW